MLEPVAVARPPVAPPRLIEAGSRFGFADTVSALKTGIAAADLWLIAEIDPQKLLETAGYAGPRARQLLFFHPRFMVRLLAANPNGVAEVPLKFVVLEPPSGPIHVLHPAASALFADHPGLGGLGDELSAICAVILDTIVG
jgi:uncharacterized protein (DUF302 family)